MLCAELWSLTALAQFTSNRKLDGTTPAECTNFVLTNTLIGHYISTELIRWTEWKHQPFERVFGKEFTRAGRLSSEEIVVSDCLVLQKQIILIPINCPLNLVMIRIVIRIVGSKGEITCRLLAVHYNVPVRRVFRRLDTALEESFALSVTFKN